MLIRKYLVVSDFGRISSILCLIDNLLLIHAAMLISLEGIPYEVA